MNVKRAFSRSNRRTKPSSTLPTPDWVDTQVSKARHILGLDSARAESLQDGSTSSASTRKLESVTFSEATTAPVHTVITINGVKAHRLSQIIEPPKSVEFPPDDEPVCQRKPSDLSLQSRASSTSIRSFYDKSRTPLSISQQTSNSSSRDFSLRRGTPSVLAESVKETEHLKQLRLASNPGKRSSRDLQSALSSRSRQDDNLSTTSDRYLTTDDGLARTPSVLSRKARSRISIIRGNTPTDDKVVTPIRHTLDHERQSRSFQPSVDPTHAKINVRRPKAGTKNWFDDVDSDSDEEVASNTKPLSGVDFAMRVENAFERGNFDMIPPRTSSRLSKAPELKETDIYATLQHEQGSDSSADGLTALISTHAIRRDRFADIDLYEHSVLCLSSSEDEDEEAIASGAYGVGSVGPATNLHARRVQSSFIMDDICDPVLDANRTSALRIRVPDVASTVSLLTPPILRRNSGRMMTHLEDDSTDSLVQEDDVLTSFPLTPVDTFSPSTSFQSLTSEGNNARDIRFVSLTKQEENLIAALRLKKLAMQKAQAQEHRRDTLRILELDSNDLYDPAVSARSSQHMISPLNPASPSRISYRPNTILYSAESEAYSRNRDGRSEVNGGYERSNRSSMATYMTDTSQDIRSLRESIQQSSMRASTKPRRTISQSKVPWRTHQDLLSATTSACTTPRSVRSKHESMASGWDGLFDSSNADDGRQVRDDIPSQLFMERPYIGWQGWEERGGEMQMIAQ